MNPTSDSLVQLLAALRARLAVVADHALRERDPAAHLEALRAAAAQLRDAELALLPPVDPTLAHYLERQSYQKAVLWLEERGLSL